MDFATAFDRVIGSEGGYVNNPEDPGGETNWGISKRAYPNLNIAKLTRDDAFAIYHRDFWLQIEGNLLPNVIAFQLLDFAINSGVQTAIRCLQRILKVADDGHFGPISRDKLFVVDPNDLLLNLLAERLDFMSRLSNWPNASRGWVRRIAQDLRYATQDN